MTIEIASLDPEIQDYIKELREEAAGHRAAYKPYKEVFSKFSEAEQRGLLHMVETLAADADKGAEMFRELADNIQGVEPDEDPQQEDEEMAEDKDKEQPDDIKAIVAAAVAEALAAKDVADTETRTAQEQKEFEEQIAYWDAEAKKLGYEPGTAEAADLFFMANRLGTGDLAEAHEKLTQYNEFVGDASTDEQSGDQEESDESWTDELDEKPKRSFPPAPGKGGPPAPGNNKTELDFKDGKAVREAVFKMLDSADA